MKMKARLKGKSVLPDVRKPVVSGMFYYLDPKHLDAQLNDLFAGVKARDRCSIVISPHAGYVYSGRTAAYAISSLRPSKNFIILGPNHSGLGKEFSVMSSGSWDTPLGRCVVDSVTAKKLTGSGLVAEDASAHAREHSIEVQLPLLQHKFSDFSFTPLCIMNSSYSPDFLEKCSELGKFIAGLMKTGKASLVASSDFSHYLPQKVADLKDGAAVEQILKLDVESLFSTLGETDASVCGFGPIAVAMAAAKELGLKGKLINKSSSGDITKDYSSVVSYYAIGFC